MNIYNFYMLKLYKFGLNKKMIDLYIFHASNLLNNLIYLHLLFFQ